MSIHCHMPFHLAVTVSLHVFSKPHDAFGCCCKAGLGLLCLLDLLLQDAPLSDCTESIEGLDPTEQAFSPAKSLSVRKVLPCHTARNTVVHPSFNLSLPLPFSSVRNYLARKF